jgi:hypothetical protein
MQASADWPVGGAGDEDSTSVRAERSRTVLAVRRLFRSMLKDKPTLYFPVEVAHPPKAAADNILHRSSAIGKSKSPPCRKKRDKDVAPAGVGVVGRVVTAWLKPCPSRSWREWLAVCLKAYPDTKRAEYEAEAAEEMVSGGCGLPEPFPDARWRRRGCRAGSRSRWCCRSWRSKTGFRRPSLCDG